MHNTFRSMFDILCITETQLDNSVNSVNIEEYCASYRKDTCAHSGAISYIHVCKEIIEDFTTVLENLSIFIEITMDLCHDFILLRETEDQINSNNNKIK